MAPIEKYASYEAGSENILTLLVTIFNIHFEKLFSKIEK